MEEGASPSTPLPANSLQSQPSVPPGFAPHIGLPPGMQQPMWVQVPGQSRGFVGFAPTMSAGFSPPIGPFAPQMATRFAVPLQPTQAQQREAMETQLYSLLGLNKGLPAELANAPTAEEIEAAELASLRLQQQQQQQQQEEQVQASAAVRVAEPLQASSREGDRPRERKKQPSQQRGRRNKKASTAEASARNEPIAASAAASAAVVAPEAVAPTAESAPAVAAAVLRAEGASSPSSLSWASMVEESDDAETHSRDSSDGSSVSGDVSGGGGGGGSAIVRKSKPQLSDESAARLTHELETLFFAKAMPPAEMEARQVTVRRLQTLMEELFPARNPKLHLFGSSVNGFGFAGADMDMCLVLQGLASDGHGAVVETLEKAFRALDYSDILALPKARVPVIKFKDPATGLGCDICFNNGLALRNSQLLAAYASLDARVRPLAFAVKTWAKARRVNNTFEGTLSSYAYVMLVIHFLQYRRPSVLPILQSMTALRNRNRPKVMVSGYDTYFYYNPEDKKLLSFGSANTESLGRLLFEFFMFFGFYFHFADRVISARTGRILTKAEKHWTKPFDKDTRSNYHFCIEDPFETTHNLGRTVDKGSLFNMRYEFRRGASILGGTFPFEETHGESAANKTLLQQLLTPFSNTERPQK